MNMKKRHHAQRAVAGAKRVCPADVSGRGDHVAVPDGHALGAAGRAAGMQNHGNIVGLGQFDRARLAAAAFEFKAQRAVLVGNGFDYRHAGADRRMGQFEGARQRNQGFGLGILVVKGKFFLLVLGIERRGGGGQGRPEEGQDHFGAVGHGNRDPVAPAQAEAV